MAEYTEQQLIGALRKADAAGDTEAARAIARRIQAMRQPQATQPDFSNVQASSRQSVPEIGQLSQEGGQVVPYVPGMGRVRGAIGEQDRSAELANRTQMFRELPLPARVAIGSGSSVARLGRGLGQIVGLVSEEDEARSREIDAAMRGDAAATVGRIGTDIGLAAVPLSRVNALTKAGQYGASAATGALYGGLQPVTEGESRNTNMVVGGALGAAGQGSSNVLMAAGQRAANAITPEVRALYQAAKDRGIELTPAQLSDSKALKFLQSQLSRLPIIGGNAKLEAQRATFNRELAKEIGEDAPVVTPEVFDRAKLRHSAQFEALTDRNSLKVTDGLLRKLGEIEDSAKVAGGQVLSDVRAAIDDLYQRAQTGPGGVSIPGAAYQAFDSQLGQITKLGTPASHFVGRVRSAVRSAMDDSISPADREAWATLRREYGNRKTLRDLVAKSEGGEISPAALMGRVTANNAGKEAMATGRRGGLGELARIGQRLKEPPSSGTAERLMSAGVGAGAIANLPVTLAALLSGGAVKKGLDSGLLARLLMREGRGQTRQAVAPMLPGAGVAAVPVVTPKERRK